MKLQLKSAIAALSFAFVLGNFALGDPITGVIQFYGQASLNGSNSTATAVNSWSNTSVLDVSGDFVGFAAAGDAVAFAGPWTFNSGPVASFWSTDYFNFDLTSSSVVYQSWGGVVVTGYGVLSSTVRNFDPSYATWAFSTQPGAIQGKFSFSAANTVPDGGTTALLLGAGLLLVGIVGRSWRSMTG